MEDFYTEELKKLPEKVKAAGYAENTTFDFEAMIGINDLWNNMQVYITSTESRGYMGQSRVGASGDFSIKLPADGNEAKYKVRAVKRINLRLNAASQNTVFCYNFSAVDQSVLLSDKEKPVILDRFETKLTAYACEVDVDSGLFVPSAPEVSTTKVSTASLEKPQSLNESQKIRPGVDKEFVLGLISSEKIKVENKKWCIQSRDNEICVVNYAGDCPCSLTFDADGKVSAQYNISSKYIAILAW